MKTPISGQIDIDRDYYRKPPNYEQTSDIERIVSLLQEKVGDDISKCDCPNCQMLWMLYVDSVAARRKDIRERQDRIEQQKVEKDVE